MSTRSIAATEYRNLPLSILTESKSNPRRIFEDAALCSVGHYVADAAMSRMAEGGARCGGHITITVNRAISATARRHAIHCLGGGHRSCVGREAGCDGSHLSSQGDFCMAVGGVEADMSQPCSDDINIHTLLEEANCRRLAEDVRRDAAKLLVRRTGTQARCAPLDDCVDTEPRQTLMLARRRQGGRLVSMPVGY